MNPQSSRSSIALGPVSTAPKPAPNPITTNMPQFGPAPGLTNADGVPALPPVSPATQPAPSQNSEPTLPKELTSPETPAPSKLNKLNLVLGLLSALFIVAAVVFLILWQQAANSKKIVQIPSDSIGQSTEDPTPPTSPAQNFRLSCSKPAEPSESQLAVGILSGNIVYDAYYTGADPTAEPTEVHISLVTEYDSPEAATADYATASEQDFESVYSDFAAFGIEISAANFTLTDNIVTFTVVVPVEKFTNPEAEIFTRQMLASLAGFPAQLSEDGTVITIQTDLDAVRANYEATGLACEIIEEIIE